MDGDDALYASAGNDVLDGGNGFDIANFEGLRSGYQIGQVDGVTMVDDDLNGIHSQILNIERIHFADSCVSFGSDIVAADTYRLYQAAFNRAPDSPGLGFWVHAREGGATMEQIAGVCRRWLCLRHDVRRAADQSGNVHPLL